jgi:hypothetical protein
MIKKKKIERHYKQVDKVVGKKDPVKYVWIFFCLLFSLWSVGRHKKKKKNIYNKEILGPDLFELQDQPNEEGKKERKKIRETREK